MKNIWGLNQFSAAANLTLFQHFLQKKNKEKKCPFTLFNKATKELKKSRDVMFFNPATCFKILVELRRIKLGY